MTEKIDLDLFARLMRSPTSTRKDILEYLGQGPISASVVLSQARAEADSTPDTERQKRS